jgi:hypothetical protein
MQLIHCPFIELYNEIIIVGIVNEFRTNKLHIYISVAEMLVVTSLTPSFPVLN